MAIIRLPFPDMVASLGGTHLWPMTGDTTDKIRTEELLGGGGDIALIDAGEGYVVPQHSTMFNQYNGRQYPRMTTEFSGANYEIGNIPTHVSNAGLTDWSVTFFLSNMTGTLDGQLRVDIGGTTYYGIDPSVTFSDTRLCAVVYDSANSEFRLYFDGAHVETVSGATSDLGGLYMWHSRTEVTFGEVAFFSTALTLDEINTIDEQRRFLGKISGTVTVDGSGSEATIRALTRVGAIVSGETTAAADGSYELWVTEPAELDVLATPPAGVAARPLAHGPITPIDQN